MASREGPQGLDGLVTESRRSGADYSARSTQELVELMNREDAVVPAVVGSASTAIARAIDALVDRLEHSGRLIYVGAGTSGRIGVLDAEECEATFSTEPGQVLAVVAGGALSSPEREAAEDDAEAGAGALEEISVGPDDAVVGISASGRTPYVVGALEAAVAAGALTVCVVSAPESDLARIAEHEILVVVGPEFVAGSTRLKAGTAQKLVLNTISTVAMIRLGKTFEDLMVDVRASNQKLEARARRIVSLSTGASAEQADQALADADGSAKVAIVSLLGGLDADSARSRLDRAKGDIRTALR
ncbi:MAG TPA: N-acetylmuramic acid 6-phosphate etherase [Gaiellaceae bacterium]|jgi:N-acetylmuramic acid 6-phosphate etherase|nr:N-acetylmuramic acid 6-phosphate etherase [Gaiellaceae bacterium]